MNLKKKQISNHEIEIFDWWLGTRKSNVRKYLNPLQFSIDCSMNFDNSLKLFTFSTLEETINLLSIRYVSRCYNCNDVLSRQEDFFDVKKVSKICPNCGERNLEEIIKDNVEIYFSLNELPREISDPITQPIGIGSGKAESLQGSMIKPTIDSNDDLSRLFSCFK
jgi:predicted RNA-binding Zn-ribbon protein involved in translation (DUF1610 family)